MSKFTYPNVILYDRDGFEIARSEALNGMKIAKSMARYMLTNEWATNSETTHKALATMKVAIFVEGAPTGADQVCEWDKEHPQHGPWLEANRQDA